MSRTENYRIAEGTTHETSVHVYAADRQGPTTFVVGGIHGDEQSGFRAAERIADWRVDRGEIVVLPRANAVAIERDSRYDDDGDLNRKFPPRDGECETAIAREIWRAIADHDPDWVFDLHSSRGIYRSGDGGVGQALFPTWTDPAREYGERCVGDLNEAFGLSGTIAYRMGNTLDADRAMLMHRVAGVLDRPGFICETTEKADLADQIRWQLFTVENVMSRYGQPPVTDPVSETRELWVDDPWRRFGLQRTYEDPVVVAKSLSHRGPDPSHARLGSVSESGFDCRVEEWDYLDDVHLAERVGGLAHEAGTHRTASGTRVKAGTVTTDESWRRVSFDQSFRVRPAVLAQPQTVRGPQPVVTRVKDVTEEGFAVRLQEEEANGPHVEERVGYVALETGKGTMHGSRFEARRLPEEVTDEWTRVEFRREYPDPTLVSGVQSFHGPDPCEIRYEELTPTDVRLKVEEERSATDETNHVAEDVGLCVIED